MLTGITFSETIDISSCVGTFILFCSSDLSDQSGLGIGMNLGKRKGHQPGMELVPFKMITDFFELLDF
jgi:hypothetical protein